MLEMGEMGSLISLEPMREMPWNFIKYKMTRISANLESIERFTPPFAVASLAHAMRLPDETQIRRNRIFNM